MAMALEDGRKKYFCASAVSIDQDTVAAFAPSGMLPVTFLRDNRFLIPSAPCFFPILCIVERRNSSREWRGSLSFSILWRNGAGKEWYGDVSLWRGYFPPASTTLA